MGTIDDWIRVFLTGTVWVLLMLLIGFPKRSSAKPTPALLGTSAGVWLLWGLFMGLFSVFYWKAFNRPLVFVTIPALLGGFVAAWVNRPKPVLSTE